MQDTFKRFGLTERDWETINLAEVHKTESGLDLVRPNELATHRPELAERYINMILTLTSFAVPEGTNRSRIAVLGNTRPGTWQGEFMRSVMQFKSFGAVFAMLHGGEIARRVIGKQYGQAAAYAGALLISTTVLGGLAMQLKSVAAGRDPQPMNTQEFWAAAVLQGGGIGIFGDFFFSDINRFGGGLAGSLTGPAIEKATSLLNLTLGNAIQLYQGEDTKFGRELVQFARGNIPGGNIWQIRLAWERLVLDQVQYLLDPQANAAFKRRQASYAKDFGQGFWWAPGSTSPQRGPNMGNALGVQNGP
jgi:hypothetical protein